MKESEDLGERSHVIRLPPVDEDVHGVSLPPATCDETTPNSWASAFVGAANLASS